MFVLVHCRHRRVDQSAHSMPSTSANTYWQIEKESNILAGNQVAAMLVSYDSLMSYTSGEVLYWEEQCRIRHLPTRLYLTVQKKETEGRPKWTVGDRCPACRIPYPYNPIPYAILLYCIMWDTIEYNNRSSVGLG